MATTYLKPHHIISAKGKLLRNPSLTVGTLYSYYKNKDGLLNAIQQPKLKDYNPEVDEKKNTILKTALGLFAHNGYSSTTMDAIALACGFSKAVLYQYFRNKEELFASIFSEAAFLNVLENFQLSKADTSLHGFLKNAGLFFLKLFEDPSRVNLIKIVMSEPNQFPQLGEIMYSNTVAVVSDKMANHFIQYANNNEIKPLDFKLAARSYFGMLYSFVFINKILASISAGYDIDQITDFAADIFENGMTK